MGQQRNFQILFAVAAVCAVVGAESAEPSVGASSTNVAPLPKMPNRQKPKVAAEDQWRTYVHTNEGLSRDGLMDDAGKVTLAGGNSLSQVSRLRLSEEQLPKYGPSFGLLTVEATPETATRLHVKIYPAAEQRWEVPESVVPRPKPEQDLGKGNLVFDFKTNYEQHTGKGSEAFALSVARRSSGASLFDTTGHSFIFKDQYIEFTTKIPKHASITGLGHAKLPSGVILPRDGSPITLWARDQPSGLASPYANLNGAHPFYMQVGADGFSHGVLFLNSNGMDIVLKEQSITFKAIGGVVDLYFFMGPYPEDVLRQYQEVIGKPMMPPFWALGSHYARWDVNVSALDRAVDSLTAAGVPVESLWLDSKVMDSSAMSNPRLRQLASKLHTAGQKWAPKQDAAVSKGSQAYTDGAKSNVWIKDYKGLPYLGQTADGESFWPDYLSNPKSEAWLTAQINHADQQASFDGLWMDISEAVNLCTGIQCKADPAAARQAKGAPGSVCQLKCDTATNSLTNPPYAIHNYDAASNTRPQKLDADIVSVTAQNHDGTTQYNAHNLYGASMAKAHYNAFTAATNKRPFNVIRSSFPGSGRFAGLWMADTGASWEALADSVPNMLVPSMWGISMVGPDVCAFLYEPQAAAADPDSVDEAGAAELCARWTSAAAFYPFARNHANHKLPVVVAAAKRANGLRYQLLSYLYTSLYLASSKGGTFARPLMFVDAADIVARNSDTQWMLGEAVMVSPVLTRNTTSIFAHFPKGNWYSAWDHKKHQAWPVGRTSRLDIPLGDIAVHYRGGAIIPKQQSANVTRNVRYSPVSLVVTLPAELSVAPKGYVKQTPAAPGQTKPAPGQTKPAPGQTKPAPGQTKPALGQTKPAPGQTKPDTRKPTKPDLDADKIKHDIGQLQIGAPENKKPVAVTKPGAGPTKPDNSNISKPKAGTGVGKPAAGQGDARRRLNSLSTADARLPADGAMATAAITPATADRLLISRPPYATEDACASIHAEHAGNLVSCGPLYMDADTVDLNPARSVQVWYTAVTAPDTRSGVISSSVVSNGGAAKDKQVKIETVQILGVTLPEGAAAGKVNVRVNKKPATAAFDAKTGVLKISGFEAVVGGPFEVTWSL